MIPLKDCDALTLAILSARATGLRETKAHRQQAPDEFFVQTIADDDPGEAYAHFGEAGARRWNPAEEVEDAVWLAARAVIQGKASVTLCLLDSRTVIADTLGLDNEEHNDRQEVAGGPEEMLRKAAKALTLSVLSALSVEGWEEDR